MKNKIFFKKLSLFLLGGLLIWGGLAEFTLRAAHIFKNGAALICEEKKKWVRNPGFVYDSEKKSVLVFGNSVILAGFRPDVFDNTLGGQVQSFNFALPASPVGAAYFILSDVLQTAGPPDAVILRLVTAREGDNNQFDYYAVQGMSFPEEFLSTFLNRKSKVAVINFLNPLRLYTHEILTYVKSLIWAPEHIEETKIKNQKIISQMKKNRGYYYVSEEALFPNGRLPDDFQITGYLDPVEEMEGDDFDLDRDPYVRKFFDLTQKYDIPVFLIGGVQRKGTGSPRTIVSKDFKILKSHYPHVRWSDESGKVIFLENKYFSDLMHLNPAGTEIYTKIIAREYKEVFLN